MNIDYKAAFVALVKALEAEYEPISEHDIDTDHGPEARLFPGALALGVEGVVIRSENLDEALVVFYAAESRGEN